MSIELVVIEAVIDLINIDIGLGCWCWHVNKIPNIISWRKSLIWTKWIVIDNDLSKFKLYEAP